MTVEIKSNFPIFSHFQPNWATLVSFHIVRQAAKRLSYSGGLSEDPWVGHQPPGWQDCPCILQVNTEFWLPFAKLRYCQPKNDVGTFIKFRQLAVFCVFYAACILNPYINWLFWNVFSGIPKAMPPVCPGWRPLPSWKRSTSATLFASSPTSGLSRRTRRKISSTGGRTNWNVRAKKPN